MAVGSTPLHQASRLLRLALTATNLHPAARTRVARRRRLRTRPKPRAATMVPGTIREDLNVLVVFVLRGSEAFHRLLHAWERGLANFLFFSFMLFL